MPTVPVKAAGWRIEPPVSVPVAPKHKCAATAAAEPPDEPPGVMATLEPLRRHGDVTGPQCEVSFDEPMANSSLLVLPSSTAPSRHRYEVTVESYVRTPSVQNMSLIASGMPSSAPALPAWMRASEAFAMASARSGVSKTNALS